MKEPKGQVYFEPPVDFNSRVDIATCYLRSGNELLFLKRQPHKPQGELWGIPGGKIDKEDDILQGMLREVKEETAIELLPEQIIEFGAVYIRYPHFDFTYHMYGYLLLGDRPDIIINQEEHTEYAWRSFKEAFSYPVILFEDTCTFLVWNDPFFDGCEKPRLQNTHPRASGHSPLKAI